MPSTGRKKRGINPNEPVEIQDTAEDAADERHETFSSHGHAPRGSKSPKFAFPDDPDDQLDSDGNLINASLANAYNTLINPELGYGLRIRHNIWNDTVEIDGRPYNAKRDKYLLMAECESVRAAKEKKYYPAMQTIEAAIIILSEQNPYNPVLDAITAEQWDGTSRLDKVGTQAFHLEPSDAVGIATVRSIIEAAVVRVLHEEPVAYPYVPIIRSDDEGFAKTDSLEEMAPGPVSGGIELRGFDLKKKAAEQMQGANLVEIAELPANDAAVDFLKDLATTGIIRGVRLTRRDDPFDIPVRGPFVWTTNRRKPIGGPSERRHPVVTIKGEIDLAWLQSHQHQLWAEVAHLYSIGHYTEPNGKVAVRLPRNLWNAARQTARRHTANDNNRDTIEAMLDGKASIPALELREMLNQHHVKISDQDFGETMSRLGWTRKRPQVKGMRTTIWERGQK